MSSIDGFGNAFTQYDPTTSRSQTDISSDTLKADQARQEFIAGVLRGGGSKSFATMMASFTQSFDAETLDRLSRSTKKEDEEEDELIKMMRQMEEARRKAAEQTANAENVQQFITKKQQTAPAVTTDDGEENGMETPTAAIPSRDERYIIEEPLDDRDKYDYIAADILSRLAQKDEWQRNRDLTDLLVAEQEAKEKQNESSESTVEAENTAAGADISLPSIDSSGSSTTIKSI